VRKWLFLALALFCVSTHAQVVKCKDATGKVTYSDRVCPVNYEASSVNLSGGNITADQIQSSRERTTSTQNGNGGTCATLLTRGVQAVEQVEDGATKHDLGALVPALQNLGAYCPSPTACAVIKRGVDYVSGMGRTRHQIATLDPLIGVYGKYCQNGGVNQARSAPPEDVQKNKSASQGFYTNDEFGNLVRSDKCFITKDAFGVSRRSAGCSQ